MRQATLWWEYLHSQEVRRARFRSTPRLLVLLFRFSIQFEAAWTNIHFIVEVRLVGAVATAHIACDLCVLDLLPIKAKEAVALHERCLVNVPGATEAGHEVDGVARTHIEGW